jgi:hypothetical protein
MVMGPITHEMMREDGMFYTPPLDGEATILELYEPKSVLGQSQLSIEKVVHGFAKTDDSPANGRTESFGAGLTCQRNTICESNYTNETNGVIKALYIANPYTASLIHNTGNLSNINSFRPYVLTATHVFGNPSTITFGGASIVANASVFWFKYYSPQCATNVDPPTSSYFIWSQGASLRAFHVPTDHALMEMRLGSFGQFGFNQQLANNGIWYLGWSRFNCGLNTSQAPVAGLHHPRGDVQKISLSRIPVGSNFPPPYNLRCTLFFGQI